MVFLIKIRDTGLGIPEDQLDDVFIQFVRVGEKEHQEIEGTGLGLAIVKSVIEKHGSTVSVESKQGEGSTFAFALARATTASSDYNREVVG